MELLKYCNVFPHSDTEESFSHKWFIEPGYCWPQTRQLRTVTQHHEGNLFSPPPALSHQTAILTFYILLLQVPTQYYLNFSAFIFFLLLSFFKKKLIKFLKIYVHFSSSFIGIDNNNQGLQSIIGPAL